MTEGPSSDTAADLLRAALDAVALAIPDGGLMVGTERHGSPVVLDPFEAQIWEVLRDGIALDELEDDVRWVGEELGWDRGESTRRLHGLLWKLNGAGLLTGRDLPPATVTSRWPTVPVDSALGRRLGLGSAITWVVREADGRPRVQFGVTDGEHAERIGAMVDPSLTGRSGLGFEEGVPFVFLRVVEGSGAWRQQVFGHRGEHLFVGRDLKVATKVLLSTAAGWMDGPAGSASLTGMALRRGDRSLLVHPALVAQLFGAIAPVLRDSGVEVGRSGVVRMTRSTDGSVVLRELDVRVLLDLDRLSEDSGGDVSDESREARLHSILLPAGTDHELPELRLAELLTGWGPHDVEALEVLRSGVSLIDVESEGEPSELFRRIWEVLG